MTPISAGAPGSAICSIAWRGSARRRACRRRGMERALGNRRRTDTPGDILHEVMQSRMPPQVTGPVGPGQLQYDAIWKTAQRLTHKPVKFGSCSGQMIDKMVVNRFYKDRRDSVMALSEALNQEYTRLADAGCPIIQIEEPCVHCASDIQGFPSRPIVEALNREVRGLRAKTEVWCHTCWGNPLAQRIEFNYSYQSVCPTSIISTSTSSPSRPRTTTGPRSRRSRRRSATTRRSASASSATARCKSRCRRTLRPDPQSAQAH